MHLTGPGPGIREKPESNKLQIVRIFPGITRLRQGSRHQVSGAIKFSELTSLDKTIASTG